MAKTSLYNGKVTISFDGRKHAYTWDEKNVFVPGVTKILSRNSKVDVLLPWSARMAAEHVESKLLCGLQHLSPEEEVILSVGLIKQTCKEAQKAYSRITKEAADIGKAAHAFAEAWLRGKNPQIDLRSDQRIQAGCRAFLQWVDEHDVRPIQAERVIFSKRWFYAGTCDFYGHVDGELVVGDFKTSKAVYIDHLLQTAAYQIAIEEELGVNIQARVLVRLDKTTGCVHHVRKPNSNLHVDAFLRLREFHEVMTKLEA